MKPITIITACAALLAASAGSWAEDTSDARAFGSGVLPDYLAMYDVDENGSLSQDELDALNADRTNPDRHRKFREQWDSDRDGAISADENKAAKIEIRRRIERRRNQRFNAVDTGVNDIGANDGFLTFREFSRIAAVAASNLDKPGIAERLFNHLDKNGDNRISRTEFLQSLDSVRPAPTVTPQPKPHPTTSLGDTQLGDRTR
jgi:Ca2+-binding EF-hand superfamily protein